MDHWCNIQNKILLDIACDFDLLKVQYKGKQL